MEQLGQTEVDRRQRQVAIVSQDSFYRILDDREKELAAKGQFNFDHPGKYTVKGQFNFDHLVNTLSKDSLTLIIQVNTLSKDSLTLIIR